MILPFRTESEVERAIPVVGAHLEQDKLLAYPTETVYGLGSSPTVPALAALSRLKGRPPDKPFLLLVSGRAMAEAWGLVMSASARALSDAFWPGPLTLVLLGGEGHLPDELRGKEGGIAVRHTSHRGIARLVAVTGRPLTSTSANRPGEPAAPGPDRIREVFQDPDRARRAARPRRRCPRQRTAFHAGGLHRSDAACWCEKARSREPSCDARREASHREPAWPDQF